MGTNRDFEYWVQEPTYAPDVQVQQNIQPQQIISPQPIIQHQSFIPQQMNIPQQPNNLQFMQPNQQQYEHSPAGQMYAANPYLNPNASGYTGTFYTPSTDYVGNESTVDGFEDEPPLLEELGINFGHIMQKTFTVLHPFRNITAEVAQDTDMAGPLVFCLAFGACLLLSGKVHFNYIYGLAVLGCCGMYALLTLMTSAKDASFGIVISILGYSMIPMVGLAGLNIVLSLKGIVGILASAFSILWCALSASKLFVTALEMTHQQPLVAYPCALLYSVFALITVF